MLRLFEILIWGGLCLAALGGAVYVWRTATDSSAVLAALVCIAFAAYAAWNVRQALRPPVMERLFPSAAPVVAPPPYDGPIVPLSQQLAEFRRIGLAPHPDLTEEALLKSFPREEFEHNPYHTLLFMCCAELEFGEEGRPASGWGWNFDLECIVGDRAYVALLSEFERLSGQAGLITDIIERHDPAAARVQLSYRLAGKPRTLDLRLNDDWADMERLIPVLQQIEAEIDDGRRFWAGDNGQSVLLLFIPDEVAAQLNRLSPDLVFRLDA